MWDFIINPFITILTGLYSLFNNDIVLAIVVFTVIIRLATAPLMTQQQRSTEKMQELQPKLKKLQEKYKNDREKLAQAQMELYRENGINPFGGCLPLMIQLPIILGLYQAVIHALGATPYQLIDLSGRLLIPGLESLVPLNKYWLGIDLTQSPTVNLEVTPLVMALPVLVMASTWLQSKLTMPPAPPDDPDGKPNPTASMTRSMTTIMPLMFGVFALSFSVGISIYFIVSNLVGIAQYTITGKAKWHALLGLPEPENTGITIKDINHDDDDDDEPEKMTVSQNGSSSRNVLKASPGQPKKSPMSGKNKTRKRK